jgi:HD-GYP domain-containing protein (c-di-GMP phosphodiesterase class II)
LNVKSGAIVRAADDGLDCHLDDLVAIGQQVIDRGNAEIVQEEPPLSTLAVPIKSMTGAASPLVALSTFVTDQVECESDLATAARAFDFATAPAWQWAQTRDVWPAHALLNLANAVADRHRNRLEIGQLRTHVADVSTQLLNTFEEITLLHRLTQHLSLSGNVHQLCELTATWLADVVPAESTAIVLALNGGQLSTSAGDEVQSLRITHGDCPLADTDFDAFMAQLGTKAYSQSLVMNRPAERIPDWSFPGVREFVSVPIREGSRFFGWLLAFNHTGQRTRSTSDDSFGTVEASLMASVAVILGIHSDNIELYREQADFFSSMVRALTSAIDAKDHYTRGHSERVAHISVCLARQLGCTEEELNTLCLSGLLHDIGKIGIDTNILRKPEALSDKEFELVKQHPEMGYEILRGVKQLDKVLPVVLHHHEAWDGTGYPHRLQGEECPLLARIAAVADSIDAMSSDRPYRRGLPDEKLDRILREGAGKQWDARIIDVVFEIREEIRNIRKLNRDERSLNVSLWAD